MIQENETVQAIRALRILRNLLQKSKNEIPGDVYIMELRRNVPQPTGLLRPSMVPAYVILLLNAGLIQVRHVSEQNPMKTERFEERVTELGIKTFLFGLSPQTELIYKALGITSLNELEKRAMGDAISVTPIFRSPRPDATRRLQRNIFVLMPFRDNLKRVYEQAITQAATACNLTIARADDFFTGYSVMTNVWEALWAADLVIADCTGRNANVFYELGMAHTIGKNTVIIAQEINDIPFDIQQYQYILYENTEAGLTQLRSDLERIIPKIIGR